jgi:GNAT superfamily N-acetyltransferase
LRRQPEPQKEARTLRHDEKKKHLDMLNLCHRPWGSEAKYRRLYSQEGFDVTKNVVVIEENGKWLGGVTGWFRQVFAKGDRMVPAYCSGDGYTLPNHRGKGVSTLALRTLQRMAAERGVALGFGFISTFNIAYRIALPKMGFVDAFYPETKVIVLNPDKFFDYIVTERLKEIQLPRKFESMKIALTVSFVSQKQKIMIKRAYEVKNGSPEQIRVEAEPPKRQKMDLQIAADIETFARVFSYLYSGRKFYLSLLKFLLLRKMRLRFSLKLLKAAKGGLK